MLYPSGRFGMACYQERVSCLIDFLILPRFYLSVKHLCSLQKNFKGRIQIQDHSIQILGPLEKNSLQRQLKRQISVRTFAFLLSKSYLSFRFPRKSKPTATTAKSAPTPINP